MAAASTDYLTHVGSPGTATTLAAPGHTIAGTSITVGSTTNWPTDTGVIFAMDTVSLVGGVEIRDVGSYTEWEGVVTGATGIGSMVLRYGTDQNYPSGSTTRVYIPVAASRENRLVDGILISLDQDGTLKAGSVDNAAVLASNVVTSTKISDGAVGATKLASAAIKLGRAQITADFTTSSGSATQVTGLTSTVTAPGSRDVKITVYGQYVDNTSGLGTIISVWNGTVGSGTQLQSWWADPAGATDKTPLNMVAYHDAPAAGSYTYNVGVLSGGGTSKIAAAATAPAFILVEAT